MRTYYIEITRPPYPQQGYRHKVHRKEPMRDECSPDLVSLIGPVQADSSADAVASCLLAGVTAAEDLADAQRGDKFTPDEAAAEAALAAIVARFQAEQALQPTLRKLTHHRSGYTVAIERAA